MAKDTFNLHEWVGKGEKNLLNEEVKAKEVANDIISKLITANTKVKNNPEAKAFYDEVFSDAGMDITSKDVAKRLLKSILLRKLDKEILDAFKNKKKKLDKEVQEGRKKGPTFIDALFADNGWLLRFLSTVLASIGGIVNIVYKIITNDYVGVIEDIVYALAFIFMALSMVFGDKEEPRHPGRKPSSKDSLKVIHRRKR